MQVRRNLCATGSAALVLISTLAAAQQPIPLIASATYPAPTALPSGAPPTGSLPATSPSTPTVTQPASRPPLPAIAPQAATPGQPPYPTQLTQPPTLVAWQAAYVSARTKLLTGDFPAAARLFEELARTAPNPTYQTLAVEQWRISESWTARQMVLVNRRDLGESSIVAKAADQRTSDELAQLYGQSVIYGLGTGLWFDVVAEAESSAGFILPCLFLAGASAGTVAFLDRGRPLRYGVPQSIVSGITLGFEEGILWTLWNQARVDSGHEWEGKTAASVIWGLTTAGAVTGGVVGSLAGTTPGRASFVSSAGTWTATLAGLTAGALSDPDSDSLDDNMLLAAAIGLNAGALTGMLAASRVSPTIARVRYLDLGALSGFLAFGGLYAAFAEESADPQVGLAMLALGTTAGVATAWWATSGMPEDQKEVPKKTASAEAFRWTPQLLPAKAGAQLGIAGTF